MPFLRADEVAGDGANNFVRVTDSYKNYHFRETLLKCFGGEHGVEESLSRVLLAVIFERGTQARKNLQSILAPSLSDRDHPRWLRHHRHDIPLDRQSTRLHSSHL